MITYFNPVHELIKYLIKHSHLHLNSTLKEKRQRKSVLSLFKRCVNSARWESIMKTERGLISLE